MKVLSENISNKVIKNLNESENKYDLLRNSSKEEILDKIDLVLNKLTTKYKNMDMDINDFKEKLLENLNIENNRENLNGHYPLAYSRIENYYTIELPIRGDKITINFDFSLWSDAYCKLVLEYDFNGSSLKYYTLVNGYIK